MSRFYIIEQCKFYYKHTHLPLKILCNSLSWRIKIRGKNCHPKLEGWPKTTNMMMTVTIKSYKRKGTIKKLSKPHESLKTKSLKKGLLI